MNRADFVGAGLARDPAARRAAPLRRVFSGHINTWVSWTGVPDGLHPAVNGWLEER